MKRDAARDADAARARMREDDASAFRKKAGDELRLRPALQLAKDLLDWDSQFSGPDDAECLVAGEDMKRWVALARKVVGR